MFEGINEKLPLSLLQILLLLNDKDRNNTFLVGGCVRDLLMNKTPKDFDIVTDMPIPEINAILRANDWKVDEVGNHFLVTVASKNGVQYEIANFRKESKSSDGRRPDTVEVGDMNSDAERRDFTINSIYLDPINVSYWDPNGGVEDIKNKKLKFIGKPHERIKEDYLRVFRFYRFLHRTGFTPDKKSLKACREMFNEAYSNSTAERVRNEIERMALK